MSKFIFVILSLSLCAGLSAHADEYQRPAPQQDEQSQIPEDYDDYQGDYQDDQVDPRYYDNEQGYEEEFYAEGCQSRRNCRPRCQQRYCDAPEILPMPTPLPVPMPLPINGGVCTVVAHASGWTIFLNGNIPLVSGLPWDSARLFYMKREFAVRRVCFTYTN